MEESKVENKAAGGEETFLEIPHPKKIKIDYSKVHFRGVFATEDIQSEELIERCPMVPLDFRIRYHNDPQLFNYLYTHKCPCEDCEKHGGVFLMVLGYGMIYNHQDTPNTIWNFRHKEKVAEVIASRPIKKGEEIFVSYGDSYFSNRKKVTIQNEQTVINENEKMPLQWRNWVKENITRGVPKEKIKEILLSNNFDICIVENVLGEKE